MTNQTTQIESISITDLEHVTGGGLIGLVKKGWRPVSAAVATYGGYSRNKAYHEARDAGKSRPRAVWDAIKHPF